MLLWLLCTPEMMGCTGGGCEGGADARPPTVKQADESFWKEGICADGLGWGHDRQNYSNGYPTQGVISALNILLDLKDTPWALRKEEICWEWVIRIYARHRLYGIPRLGASYDWKNEL